MSAVTAIVTGSRNLTAVKYVSINLLFGFCFPWFQLKKKKRDEVSVQKNSFMQVFEKKMIIIDKILTKNSQKRNALQCKGMGEKNTYMY